MIWDHYENQCPRLAALDNYIKARNDNIYSGSRRVEKEKSDHRAAHNFAKIINVFDVGYNTGIPIKKRSDSEEINRMIDEYDQRNDIEALDSPVPASILASIWLAGILHPDQVSTDTYTKEMNSFYETFYGIKK